MRVHYLRCFGRNHKGQLGTGDQVDLNTAAFEIQTAKFGDVDLGDASTCALGQNGNIWCWGDNADDRLVSGQGDILTSPTAVTLATAARSISVGFAHQCVVDEAGDVHCWGQNDQGQVDGTVGTFVTTPTKVVMPTTWGGVPQTTVAIKVSAGWKHTCALMADRTSRCWGTNAEFEHGVSAVTSVRAVEVVASSTNGAIGIVAGRVNSGVIKLTSGGALFLWGGNAEGTFGNGVTGAGTHAPTQVPSLPTATDRVLGVTMGDNNVCALLSNSFVQCWGSNVAKALGNGLTTGTQATPARHQWLP
jgi:alpha-tubulin suppressor-like RCC1 family protein